MVLVLLNANLFVQMGFSINEETLIKNLKNECLDGLRRIYDTLMYYGGELSKITLSKSIIYAAQNACNLYQEALKRKKSEKNEDAQRRAGK